MNPFHHKKIWKGTLIYQKGYGKFKNEKLEFDFQVTDIDQLQFQAISKDTAGFGINPSKAKIRGEFKDQSISFTKIYLQDLYFDKDEKFYLDEEKESLPIYYEGQYFPTENKFKGSWKMQLSFKILWLFPFSYTLNGIWFME